MAENTRLTEQTPRVVAAFDIGSNSIKMTVGRELPDQSVEEFLWDAATTRLGEGIDTTHRIKDERAEATLEALEGFALRALQAGAQRMVGVATEAVRLAENGPELLTRIREATGIAIQSISGDQEAQLTFDGLGDQIDRNGRIVVADIGGGSTELIEAVGGKIVRAQSLPIGSGRLTDRFILSDPPLADELAQTRSHVNKAITEATTCRSSDRLIVVGGTAEYLRRLLGCDWPVEPVVIEDILSRVSRMASQDLAVLVDAPPARARVLPAGIAAVAGIADIVRPSQEVGAASGIRLGLLKAAFAGEL